MNITKKDVYWNYAGNIFNIGISIIVLPFILKLLPLTEIGLWYVFVNISGLIGLIDFGFSPTIIRNITYCWCGAQTLQPEGYVQIQKQNQPNYVLLKKLIFASKRIYLFISIIALCILLIVGTFYIYKIIVVKSITIIIAWIIYSFAISINIYFCYWMSLLRGIGAFKKTNQAIIISRTIYIMIAVIGLLINCGLLALSISLLVSGLILAFVSKIYFLKIVGKEFLDFNNNDKSDVKEILLIILPNAKKAGIMSLGGFLATRSNTLLCSAFLGLEVTASYGLSMQMFNIIGSFASVFLQSYIPALTAAQINGDNARVKLLFSRSMVIQWIIFITGTLLFVFVVPEAIVMMGSNLKLLNQNMLLVLGVFLFLECNLSSFGTYLVLSNEVPFMKQSIIAGFSIVILSLILLNTTSLGVWSLIISQGFVQNVYNNWYWPRLACKKMDTKISKLFVNGLKQLMFGYTK